MNKKYCIDCKKDISELGNHSFRCKKCQRDYNNFKRREKRAKEREGIVRICKQCSKVDISDRHYHATICWGCRRKNQSRADKNYYRKHREQHRIAQKKYYKKNKERIIKKNTAYQKKKRREKKKILDLDLKEKSKAHWVEWDDIPRCEGVTLDYKSFNNPFGNRCALRACYRLKDKYDGRVRYVCGLHLKTIGSLKWYRIEKLDLQVAVRRLTKVKWKRMQEMERKKKIKKNSKKKRREPMPYHNAHIPIVDGMPFDRIYYPKEEDDDG